jgi:hypothetical protein
MSSESSGAILGLVAFGTHRRLYRRAILTAQDFNRSMGKIYSSATRVTSRRSYLAPQQDPLTSLAQFSRLSEASRQLLGFLEQIVCRKQQTTHEGHLRLSSFVKSEFDVLLSICGHENLWQQAYFRVVNEETQGNTIDSICTELKQSQRSMKSTRVMFNEAHILRDNTAQGRIRVPPKPSKLTLGDILRDERQRRGVPGHRILKHNTKKGLGVEVATALLHLFGCPQFRSEAWNSDSIYILK